MPPVFAGGETSLLFEDLYKIIGILNTTVEGDALHLQMRGAEKMQGIADTLFVHMSSQSLTGLFFELRGKVGGGDLLHGGESVKTEVGGNVCINIGNGALNKT